MFLSLIGRNSLEIINIHGDPEPGKKPELVSHQWFRSALPLGFAKLILCATPVCALLLHMKSICVQHPVDWEKALTLVVGSPHPGVLIAGSWCKRWADDWDPIRA